MRLTRNAGIQQQKAERTYFDLLVECAGRQGIRSLRERRAHQLAAVVIAGNGGKGKLQRREQAPQMVIFLRIWSVGEIARDHHEIRRRRERIQRRHAMLQRLGSVDAAVGELARRLPLQVGNLGNAKLSHRRRQSSSGNRRTASGRIDRPTRSPVLACTVLDASIVSGLSATPLTTRRWRSPLKATLSTVPANAAAPASTKRMDSGRTIAIATARLTSLVIGCRPPGNSRCPFSTDASMMLAAPMKPATKRLRGVK